MAIFISLVIASAVALPGPAALDGYSPAYDRCITTGDAAQGITAGIMDCLGTEIDVQDAALNQTYKATMARLDPAGRTRLRADERRWIARRDERCHAEADEEGGGSLSGIMYNNCVLDQTIARTRFLKTYTPKR